MSTMTPPECREDQAAAGRCPATFAGYKPNFDPNSSIPTTATAALGTRRAAWEIEKHLASCSSGTKAKSWRWRYAGFMTMARPRSSARTSLSRPCKRSDSCVSRKLSGAGFARSRSAWRSIALSDAGRIQGMDPETLEGQMGDELTPDQHALATERDASVRAGLARLGPWIARRSWRSMSRGSRCLEMSDEFRAPLGTIKRRLHVARKRLAKQMESLVAV
jgi:hypothetical protein